MNVFYYSWFQELSEVFTKIIMMRYCLNYLKSQVS